MMLPMVPFKLGLHSSADTQCFGFATKPLGFQKLLW